MVRMTEEGNRQAKELVATAQAGDMSARAALAELYARPVDEYLDWRLALDDQKPWIRRILYKGAVIITTARHYERQLFADVKSEGNEAFLDAIDKICTPGKIVEHPTAYIRKALRNAIDQAGRLKARRPKTRAYWDESPEPTIIIPRSEPRFKGSRPPADFISGAAELWEELTSLHCANDMERQILEMLAAGKTTTEIAAAMEYKNKRTVERHRAAILYSYREYQRIELPRWELAEVLARMFYTMIDGQERERVRQALEAAIASSRIPRLSTLAA